ncbi:MULTISPECIES: hypothetical protein [unclassified Devosia]|uniref:hypothetical protein n=1 Tax=unclassified Devosia TaxID=196773 RepID=UPI001AC10D40|nr:MULTISPECIES: hypothetical protein [unclassified Devosia]MBN9305395.1 hypothetical protein [Devosia sp.]
MTLILTAPAIASDAEPRAAIRLAAHARLLRRRLRRLQLRWRFQHRDPRLCDDVGVRPRLAPPFLAEFLQR